MKRLQTSGFAAMIAIAAIYAIVSYSHAPQISFFEAGTVVEPPAPPANGAAGAASADGPGAPGSIPSVPEAAQSKAVIYIDPGHQRKGNSSPEPVAPGSKATKPKAAGGTTGVSTGKPEYALTLEVALLLKQKLAAKGCEVLMTREEHDVDISNKQRAELANDANATLVVRIHADGNASPKAEGFSVLYPHPNAIPDEAVQTSSRLAAQFIHDALQDTTGAKSRGVVARQDLTGFNWSKVPVVLVEMGFMTNPAEDEKMSDSGYQEQLAEGMARGIEAYLQNS